MTLLPGTSFMCVTSTLPHINLDVNPAGLPWKIHFCRSILWTERKSVGGEGSCHGEGGISQPHTHPNILSRSMCWVLDHVCLFVTLWTVACQAPLSMGFSMQKYYSGLPWPPTGDFPNPGIKPTSFMSPALAGRFFAARANREHNLPHSAFPVLPSLNSSFCSKALIEVFCQ